jgi:cation transporter-like permease
MFGRIAMALVSFSAKHARSWYTSSAAGWKLFATLFLGLAVALIMAVAQIWFGIDPNELAVPLE